MGDYGTTNDLDISEEEKLRVVQSTNSWSTTGSIRVPVTLTWEDISYKVKVTTKRCPPPKKTVNKTILRHISGIVKPGQLLAILGSTGAGKSTLLDVLAQRKPSKQVKGRILVNGKPPDKYFKRLSAYVTQDDALPGLLTVRETLQFYADLKLPTSISRAEKKKRVEEVIEILGLEKVADSRVGTQFRRGISGGEKKRLSIGSQLITDPGLLFLDEPTTGLDAYNSLSVIETMNRLCTRGRTIVCTIHQPRSTIFELFDQLMVLSQGRTVYFGPASQAVDYFSALGFSCGKFINPADFFIDITVTNEPILLAPKSERHSLLQDGEGKYFHFPQAYSKSELSVNTKQEIDIAKKPAESYPDPGKLKEYATNWVYQSYKLSLRAFRIISRNPMVTVVQLVQTLFIALLVGSIYFQIGMDQASIQDRVGALFFIMTNQAFAQIASLNLFLEERDLFNRERAAGTYTTSAYFLSKTIIETPIYLIFPIVFGIIAYWMVGLQATIASFGVFLLVLVTFAMVAGSLFMFIGAVSPNVVVAQIFSPLVIVLFMLFGGFYINVNNIPDWYVWLYYLSFFNYGFEILCYNEFHGWNDGQDVLQFECTSGQPCVQNGDQELAVLGYSDVTTKTVWTDFGVLFGMALGYRILAYLCLRFLYKEKR